MSRSRHNHVYKRVNLGKDKEYIVYKCIKPGCSHFVREELILDRVAECPECEGIFTIKKPNLSRKVLIICLPCRKKHGKKVIPNIDKDRLNTVTDSLLSRVFKED